MFNSKQTKSSKKHSLISAGITVLAFAVTFSFAAIANAEIKASVTKPVLRSEYKGTDSISLDSSLGLVRGNQRINVSLRDSDLKQALRMIADKAGLNIIFHSSVSGNVTLDLVNVTLNDAFKMILQATDMSFFLDKGTLVIMSQETSVNSNIGKQNMMVLPVKYADSSKVADFLNSNIFSTNRPGLSNNKIVVTNPVTNELIIFGTQNDYRMAQRVVSKLDVAPKTISFRVNHTTPKEMATLICQSLFPGATMGDKGGAAGSAGGAGGGAGSAGSSGGGAATGGAADSSGGSSSGGGDAGSGGSSSGGSSSADITLGEGKIACTMKGSVTANKLSSLSGSALTVTYFPQKGTINITGGSDSQGEMIKNFIKGNDRKQPQAYVEMQIVELNENGSKDFSNTWKVWSPFFSGTFDGTGGLKSRDSYPSYFMGSPIIVTKPNLDPTAKPELVEYNNRYHGPVSVGWSISYLIKNGKGRLLANPKVIVTNGKKSTINLTSDYIKKTDEELLTSTGGVGQAGVQRTYEIGNDNGISVDMTPFISPDGYVTMNLKPHYATIKEQMMSKSSSGGDIVAATLLQRRDLDLANVRIKDGETLVLGGLIQENETKTVTKMPFLGDLPVIGSVFRSTNTKNEKTELIIMITPRIVKDTEDFGSDNENL